MEKAQYSLLFILLETAVLLNWVKRPLIDASCAFEIENSLSVHTSYRLSKPGLEVPAHESVVVFYFKVLQLCWHLPSF